MQNWSWSDVCFYFLCVVTSMVVQLSPISTFIMVLKLPLFIFVELPLSALREFQLVSFDRRYASRWYDSVYEFGAQRFIKWALRTYQAPIAGPILFGENHARLLFHFRRFKYGPGNIGDYDFYPLSVPYKSFNGYWVTSASRKCEPDLVIYFVPGNLAGFASSYWYIEYLSMLLMELQVQGFRNPAALVADIKYYKPGGLKSKIKQAIDGWELATKTYAKAGKLIMGSGVGGLISLSLCLHFARPFEDLLEEPPQQETGKPSSDEISAVAMNKMLASLKLTTSKPTSAKSASQADLPGAASHFCSGKVPISLQHHVESNTEFESHPEPSADFACEAKTETEWELQVSENTMEVSESEVERGLEQNSPKLEAGSAQVHKPTKEAGIGDLENAERSLDPKEGHREEVHKLAGQPKREMVKLPKPDAMLLLSPIGRLEAMDTHLHQNVVDIISKRPLMQLARRLGNPEEARKFWAMPGNVCDTAWWEEALPSKGTVVMYGGAETLRSEISSLISKMKGTTANEKKRVISLAAEDYIHAWPIVAAYTARRITEQFAGVEEASTHISNMLVMDCVCSDQFDV